MKRKVLLVVVCALCGCADQPREPKFRGYDLNVFHPAPYSTFVGIAPGAQGEALPRVEELDSRDFNTYLRDVTGCTVASGEPSYPIGNERDPAGYMVPISCMNG